MCNQCLNFFTLILTISIVKSVNKEKQEVNILHRRCFLLWEVDALFGTKDISVLQPVNGFIMYLSDSE